MITIRQKFKSEKNRQTKTNKDKEVCIITILQYNNTVSTVEVKYVQKVMMFCFMVFSGKSYFVKLFA